MANEKRLIDGNGSYTINASDNTGHSLCYGGGIISVMDEYGHCICEFDAEDAPTVDAVEVVRCKDCKMFCPEEIRKLYNTEKYCMRTGWMVNDDDFCSYGERKTE